MKEENEGRPMGQVIKIDEARIRDHLGELVRGSVEETLNALLDAEADELCGAGRYQRSAERVDTRAGSYDRTLQTKAGEVKLKVPKLRQQVFETAIIERYRRRELITTRDCRSGYAILRAPQLQKQLSVMVEQCSEGKSRNPGHFVNC